MKKITIQPKMNRRFLISLWILLFLTIPLMAQFKNVGKLNIWTTQEVQRNHYDSGCLSKIRVDKNKGFDRIVFEFNGGLNGYTIYYLPSNKDTEGEKITIAGNVFMQINLYGSPCENENQPEGKLKLPIIQQIRGGIFEGIQDFVIGVKAEKLYRVQELKNPSRLVIDFKH
jgi:hypothetical protein